jgi:hypothetical protein
MVVTAMSKYGIAVEFGCTQNYFLMMGIEKVSETLDIFSE